VSFCFEKKGEKGDSYDFVKGNLVFSP